MSLHLRQQTRTEDRVFEIEQAGCKVRVHVKVTSLDDGPLGAAVLAQIHAFLEKAWKRDEDSP